MEEIDIVNYIKTEICVHNTTQKQNELVFMDL